VVLNRQHLETHHERAFNLRKVLDLYQLKRRRNQANKIISNASTYRATLNQFLTVRGTPKVTNQ
jgi:hypothetical protein